MSNRKSRILVLLLMLLGFGCGGNDHRYPDAPADSRAESIVLESRPFEIGSDTYGADFGTITVPENREKGSSRLISIPFLQVHSHATDQAEPIFALSGGPGQSNMSWDWWTLGTFLRRHDVVIVGYRGVDGSSVLDLPEVTEALEAHGDPVSERSVKAIGRAFAAGADRLRAEGVDLDGYTMLECIEDNESVRRALGYGRIDLLSASYGTRIAYLYGLRHPDRVFRSAMISVNPPGHFIWAPATTDAQLRYYATLWSRDTGMAEKSPDLYATMRTVLTAMPDRWLFFPIDPGKVRVVTFALLFQRKTAAMVFDAYVAAEHGDPSGLALMSLAYDHVIPTMGVWGDFASKAVSADYDSTRNYGAEEDSPDMPLGAPMNRISWGTLSGGCWPMKLLPEEFRKLRQSDVQTLLLSGSIDFSTPAEFATQELLPFLKNGRQVILTECGHVEDLLYANVDNARLLLTSFYDTGVPDTSLNAYIPMTFGVSWGFPIIAKAALAAVALLAIALIAAATWLVRRYRRRRQAKTIGQLTEVTNAR